MVSHHRWNALSLECGAGDFAHEAAPDNVSNAIPQITKQQLRGLIAAFAVLTLLLIMSTAGLGAIALSVQHSTRRTARSHATPP